MSQRYERLPDYAKRLGIAYPTAWKHFSEGKIPGATKINGSIVIPIDSEVEKHSGPKRAATYARVSSSQNKANAETQSERLGQFCTANGWILTYEIKETASGTNENRPKLWKLLNYEDWDVLVVEHKDRLTRFGFSYLEALIEAKGKELVVVNRNAEEKEELMEDLTSIITSFCARIYGQRRSKRKTEKIVSDLKSENDG